MAGRDFGGSRRRGFPAGGEVFLAELSQAVCARLEAKGEAFVVDAAVLVALLFFRRGVFEPRAGFCVLPVLDRR